MIEVYPVTGAFKQCQCYKDNATLDKYTLILSKMMRFQKQSWKGPNQNRAWNIYEPRKLPDYPC